MFYSQNEYQESLNINALKKIYASFYSKSYIHAHQNDVFSCWSTL